MVIKIEHIDEETFYVYVDSTWVGGFNHDTHGWDGMRAAKELVINIADALGIEVEYADG